MKPCSLHQAAVLAILAASVVSIPLNINLGAYSPALVVGDGEISFNGAEAGDSAAELMETLATGAADSDPANQAANANIVAPAAPAASDTSADGADGATDGADGATDGATDGADGTDGGDAADGGDGADAASPAMIRKKILTPFRRAPSHKAKAKRSLSPLGAVSKREVERPAAAVLRREPEPRPDIEGFRASLDYAKEAMKNQPEVELSTGKEGSGVGIIVNPGVNVPKDSAAAGDGKKKRSVEEVEDEGEGEKLGITLLAIREV